MQRSIFLACLALAACAAGGVADPFYVHVNPSLRTAYHSRARIVEDRPMLMTLTRAGFDTKNVGDFGKVGFWNWTVSSLTDRRATRHRHALNEMDYGVFWTYVWDFGRLDDTWRGWGLTTDVMKDWLTFEGYSHPARLAKTNASISEWRLAQSLDNPYLTPFYLVRRGLHPHDWLYVQTGAGSSRLRTPSPSRPCSSRNAEAKTTSNAATAPSPAAGATAPVSWRSTSPLNSPGASRTRRRSTRASTSSASRTTTPAPASRPILRRTPAVT